MGQHLPVVEPLGARVRGALCRVSGGSMEPALRAADLVQAEACDVATLRAGDLVVMQGRVGSGGGATNSAIVHRLVEARRDRDGFRLRTKGDNRLVDDGIWTESDLVGRVVRIWRGTSTGYHLVATSPQRNRWHAGLARAESRAWAMARTVKHRLFGRRPLGGTRHLARALHGLVRIGHLLLQATATRHAPEGQRPS